jgi:plasmid stabilization system protein ParE
MNPYILAAAAELDLDAIWEFIAKDNLDSADRQIAALFDAFEALAQTPGMGHTRQDLTSLPLLFWPVGTYLVVYRVQPERVEIVAVLHGARDLPTVLHRREG